MTLTYALTSCILLACHLVREACSNDTHPFWRFCAIVNLGGAVVGAIAALRAMGAST